MADTFHSGIGKAIGTHPLGIVGTAALFSVEPGTRPITLIPQKQKRSGDSKQKGKRPEVLDGEKDD